MSPARRSARPALDPALARVPMRRILVLGPTIRFRLRPGDRALVRPGDTVTPGMALAERTPDPVLMDVGKLPNRGPEMPRPMPLPTPAAVLPPVSARAPVAAGPVSAMTAPVVAPEPAAAAEPLWRAGASEFDMPRPTASKPVAAPEPEPVASPDAEVEAPVAAEPESRAAPDADVEAPAAAAAPSQAQAALRGAERRRPPEPGKWWVGGDDRRGKSGGKYRQNERRIAGTLLFETHGRWRAAAGERHETFESPVAGVVAEARNGVEITVTVTGVAMPGAIGAGEPSRGYLDVPRLTDGDLWATALDVARSGAIVVAGSRISAQAISRARAMSIRGLLAGSVGQGELRDLAASEARQRAGIAAIVPFGLLALDGHQRRPIATPVLALLAAMAGREVAIVTDPPMLVFDVSEVPLPELPPDWVRVRSGQHAGREGRFLGSAGLHRFRAGIHLESASVRLGDDESPAVIALSDLERFVF